MSPPLLLAVLSLLGASPPLTAAEREYFAAPLLDAAAVVRAALAARQIRCKPSKPIEEARPESWIAPQSALSLGSLKPASWMVLFDCQSPSGARQLAIQLYECAVVSPTTMVLSSGKGFFIRDVGGAWQLGIGRTWIFEPSGPVPDEVPSGRPLAAPVALSVAAEDVEWLKLLPVAGLSAVLERAATLTPPPTAFVYLPPRPAGYVEPPKAPAAQPYQEAPGPVARVKSEGDWLLLTRAPSDNEQAYYATVAARGHQALIAAFAATGLHCALRTDVASCARAEWSRGGFVPDCWESFWHCDDGVSLMVNFSAGLGGARGSGTTTEQLARDLRLEWNRDSGFGQLVLGEPLTAASTRPAGGIAALEAVALSGDGLQRLVKTIDLKPLRALLNSPSAPPSGTGRVAAAAPLDDSKRAERKAEVRSLALEGFAGEKVEQLVLFDQTLKAALEPRALAFLRSALPQLDRSALDEFSTLAARSRAVQSTELGRPVRLLSAQQQNALFERRDAGPDGWARYRLQFPRASGIIHLSEVGLSRDGNQAVIAVDWQAGWLAGGGETWFLRRTDKGWEKICVLQRWIS